LREARAKAVGARDVGARFRAEDDARALAIERFLRVARVIERAARDLEGEELHGVDRGERSRRDSIGTGIEERTWDEAAPLGRRLFARSLRIEVELRVPALGRHFPNGVFSEDDVGPECFDVGRVGVDAGHAHDRDVGRSLRGSSAGGTRDGVELGAAPFAHVTVELGHRAARISERSDLTEHEEPLAPLLVGVDRDELRPRPPKSLRGHTQPSEVELFERGPRRLRVAARRREARPLVFEGSNVFAHRASRLVPRRGFQERRPRAADRLVLKRRQDRGALNRLLGEEVSGAHEDADLRPSRGEWRRERGDDPGRRRVVDPSCEKNAHVVDPLAGEKPFDGCLPQHEARSRPDVPAALTALEDEPARSLLQEHVEKRRGRHVQESRDAELLERLDLRRAASGDERDRRAHFAEKRELLVAQLGRDEAENTDAPRSRAQTRARFFEERAGLGASHQ
jgi:hypothetical protein